jgi:hypothetical protein
MLAAPQLALLKIFGLVWELKMLCRLVHLHAEMELSPLETEKFATMEALTTHQKTGVVQLVHRQQVGNAPQLACLVI